MSVARIWKGDSVEPSNLRLVTEVAAVLRDRVAPALSEDPRAASELRSVCSVLGLVAARIEHEDSFEASDNAALQQLFADLTASGMNVAPVERKDREPAELNTALRSALEHLLPELHDGSHPDQLAAVRAYLRDASRQEIAIYGPLTAFPF